VSLPPHSYIPFTVSQYFRPWILLWSCVSQFIQGLTPRFFSLPFPPCLSLYNFGFDFPLPLAFLFSFCSPRTPSPSSLFFSSVYGCWDRGGITLLGMFCSTLFLTAYFFFPVTSSFLQPGLFLPPSFPVQPLPMKFPLLPLFFSFAVEVGFFHVVFTCTCSDCRLFVIAVYLRFSRPSLFLYISPLPVS